MDTMRLHGIADSLEWLARQLRMAAAGDDEAAAVVRCFMRDWCGMVAIGPAVLAEDVAGLVAAGDRHMRTIREDEAAEAEAEKHQIAVDLGHYAG